MKPDAGFASGGAGYLLSRKAAAIVAEKLVEPARFDEDVLVSQCLAAEGIAFHKDQRFVALGRDPNPGVRARPGASRRPRPVCYADFSSGRKRRVGRTRLIGRVNTKTQFERPMIPTAQRLSWALPSFTRVQRGQPRVEVLMHRFRETGGCVEIAADGLGVELPTAAVAAKRSLDTIHESACPGARGPAP